MANTPHILHIVDDEKFIDAAYRVFEKAAPGAHEFISYKKGSSLGFIKDTPVKILSPWMFPLYRLFPSLMPRYDTIIVHNLNLPKIRFLQCLKYEARVCWIGWGFDYYDLIGKELLKTETRNIPLKKPAFSFLDPVRAVRARLQYGNARKEEVLEKIDYLAPVLREDYELLVESFPGFGPEYAEWNYSTLEDDLVRGFEGGSVNGNNILLGNSATPPNNHLDAFKILNRVNLAGRKIIVPLAYGDEAYRDEILQSGKEEFGDTFVPLVDFLPNDEYIRTISSCSIVVMNHRRQQGLGNILTMLYLGAKVFLDPDNTIYPFLKNNGLAVYTLDDLGAEMDFPAPPGQVEKNREVIRSIWSREVMVQKTRDLLEKVQGV